MLTCAFIQEWCIPLRGFGFCTFDGGTNAAGRSTLDMLGCCTIVNERLNGLPVRCAHVYVHENKRSMGASMHQTYQV